MKHLLASCITKEIAMANEELQLLQDEFIARWGIMGSAWGTTVTIARMHALLMITEEPMTTDQVMERLEISRGNAHASLKEMLSLGIVQKVFHKGVRKDLFIAEKEPWKIFLLILADRRRKEVIPTLNTLNDCIGKAKNLDLNESQAFCNQLGELKDFLETGDRVLQKVGNLEGNNLVKFLLKFC